MNLSTNLWYIRLFYFCEMIWLKFQNSWFETNSRNTNLCTFIRTIFVWAPLAVAANLAAYGWIAYVFFYYPIHTFGAMTVGITLGSILSIMAFAISVAWMALKFRKTTLEAWQARPRPVLVPKEPKAPKPPGFIELVWQWLVDSHNNICVTIKLETPVTQETVS